MRTTAWVRVGLSAGGLAILGVVASGCSGGAGEEVGCVQGDWTMIPGSFGPEQEDPASDDATGIGQSDLEVLVDDSSMRAQQDTLRITQHNVVEYRITPDEGPGTEGWTTIEGSADFSYSFDDEVVTISEVTDAEGSVEMGATSGTNPEMTSDLPYADYAESFLGEWQVSCDDERMTWTPVEENGMGEVTFLRD